MNKLLIATCLFFIFFWNVENIFAADIKYVFLFDGNNKRFKVNLEFEGNNSGVTNIVIPKFDAGIELEKIITDVELLNKDYSIQKKDSGVISIKHKPNGLIKLQYRVSWRKLDVPHYALMIENCEFFFKGSSSLVLPKLEKKINSVEFNFPNFPHKIVTNYGKLINGRFTLKKDLDNYANLIVFLGGDFSEFFIPETKTFIYLNSLKQEEYIEPTINLVKRIQTSQNNFFGNKPKETKFFFILQEACEDYFYGERKNNTYMIFIAGLDTRDNKESIVSHENLHNWFGGILHQNSVNELADKWFFEGFTDYYSDYINYRYGIISFEEYIDLYNHSIKKYYQSIYKNTNNVELSRLYWSGLDSKTIYYRGRIFAFELDHKIKNYSNNKYSLDDVIKFMMNKANLPKDKLFTNEYFLNSVKKVTGYDARPALQKYILNGNTEPTIPIISGLNGEKASLSCIKSQIADYGFDWVQSRLFCEIKNINSKSQAYKAGLRNNDKFYSSWHDKTITIRVWEDSKYKDITFTPDLIEIDIPFYKII